MSKQELMIQIVTVAGTIKGLEQELDRHKEVLKALLEELDAPTQKRIRK